METKTYRPARLILLGGDASPRLRRSTCSPTARTALARPPPGRYRAGSRGPQGLLPAPGSARRA